MVKIKLYKNSWKRLNESDSNALMIQKQQLVAQLAQNKQFIDNYTMKNNTIANQIQQIDLELQNNGITMDSSILSATQDSSMNQAQNQINNTENNTQGTQGTQQQNIPLQ